MNARKSNRCPVPKGLLVIIGGHEDKSGKAASGTKEDSQEPRDVLKEFVRLLKGRNPRLEVITTASQEGLESFKDYEKVFKKLGVKNIGHIHHDKRSEALDPELTDRIQKSNAVFFTGGDQLKLTSIYGGTPFLVCVKNLYIKTKFVVAGTSAGAMALSTPMIYAGNKGKQQISGEIRITTGLEFLKDVCVDTHFVDRSRFVRISQVIATNPTSVGIGIEEDTALVVRNGIDAEVIGNGVVIIVEGFGITDKHLKFWRRSAY